MNLTTLFPQFRTATEDGGRPSDPWSVLILCQHGHIYRHSQTHLGAATSRSGSIAKRLAALPCVRVTQDGTDGVNVVFAVADFEDVAAIMRPRVRRKLSAEHKAKLAASNVAFRFASGAPSDEQPRV